MIAACDAQDTCASTTALGARAQTDANGRWPLDNQSLASRLLPLLFPSCTRLRLHLSSAHAAPLTHTTALARSCSQSPSGAAYPACLPLMACSCPCAPPPVLRRITRALACAARKLAGQPMLHDLVGLASEALLQLHPEDELSEDEEVCARACVCVRARLGMLESMLTCGWMAG